jgi:hypothetical protein
MDDEWIYYGSTKYHGPGDLNFDAGSILTPLNSSRNFVVGVARGGD